MGKQSKEIHHRPAGKSLSEVVDELGIYPLEAFEFVQQGLGHTAARVHGPLASKQLSPGSDRHVTGQQLAEGLRDYAQLQWGYMARAVLARWGIRSTYDFGRIVFALVDSGFLRKTEEDSVDDFRNVYDFETAFERQYKVHSKL
jgi:uncharacterized repeat protein (TIGR04138 family)